MKYILTLVTFFYVNQLQAFEQDKIKHFTATTVISSATYLLARSHNYTRTESFISGLLVANTIGVMKEMTDTRFDGKDIQANVLGSFFGVVLVVRF